VYANFSRIVATYDCFPCYDFVIHVNLVRKESLPSCTRYYQESVPQRFNVKEGKDDVILESVTIEVERFLQPGPAIGV
jgi:hypothetical protein